MAAFSAVAKSSHAMYGTSSHAADVATAAYCATSTASEPEVLQTEEDGSPRQVDRVVHAKVKHRGRANTEDAGDSGGCEAHHRVERGPCGGENAIWRSPGGERDLAVPRGRRTHHGRHAGGAAHHETYHPAGRARPRQAEHLRPADRHSPGRGSAR
eukprot:7377911-Prymnesium_polylepis.1